jgi:hypothetical protein
MSLEVPRDLAQPPSPSGSMQVPAQPTPAGMAWHERQQIRCAAEHARRALPGPIGEYLYRDLMSIQNCALRFDHYGVTARMIQAVLSIAPPEGT